MTKINKKKFIYSLLFLSSFYVNAQNEKIILDSLNQVNALSEIIVKNKTKEEVEVKKIKENIMPVTIITAKQIENRAGNLNEILASTTPVVNTQGDPSAIESF